jgi:hypothetical protein
MVARMHPEGVGRLHDFMTAWVEQDGSGRILSLFYGDLTLEQFQALPDHEVAARTLERAASAMPGLLHALVVRDVRIVGSVPDPPDRAHVVYRSTSGLQGAVPEIRVLSVKRDDGEWRVLWSQELDAIQEALRGLPLMTDPPPGEPSTRSDDFGGRSG